MPTFNLGQAAYVNRGDYDASAAYIPLNTAFYNGGTWVALSAFSNVTPGTDSTKWLCITQGLSAFSISPGASGYVNIAFVLTDGTSSSASIPFGGIGSGTITVPMLASSFILPVSQGGTGASTASGALVNLGAQGVIHASSGTLLSTGWDSSAFTQNLSVVGMPSTAAFIAQPDTKAGWIAAQDVTLYPPTAGSGLLAFEAGAVPSADIHVQVYWWE